MLTGAATGPAHHKHRGQISTERSGGQTDLFSLHCQAHIYLLFMFFCMHKSLKVTLNMSRVVLLWSYKTNQVRLKQNDCTALAQRSCKTFRSLINMLTCDSVNQLYFMDQLFVKNQRGPSCILHTQQSHGTLQ